jgi:TetR/AcrR family transcriptional regulator, lmrAB and yxaGH operons repressor
MAETKKGSPRQRMIQSAALLMREHGVEAMSFSQVVQHSGAPRGSIYHYFPGGKAQLVEEATRWAGDFIARRTARAIADRGPLAMLDDSERFWGDVLGGTDFGSGCPVVAATLDGERSPAARAAAAEAFGRWSSVFASALRDRGISDSRAEALGTMVFASIEGAVIMARAARSLDPLTRVLAELRIVVSAALDAVGHQATM